MTFFLISRGDEMPQIGFIKGLIWNWITVRIPHTFGVTVSEKRTQNGKAMEKWSLHNIRYTVQQERRVQDNACGSLSVYPLKSRIAEFCQPLA